MTPETRKGYDAAREHRQQGSVNPIEERFNTYKVWYKQILAKEKAKQVLTEQAKEGDAI